MIVCATSQCLDPSSPSDCLIAPFREQEPPPGSAGGRLVVVVRIVSGRTHMHAPARLHKDPDRLLKLSPILLHDRDWLHS